MSSANIVMPLCKHLYPVINSTLKESIEKNHGNGVLQQANIFDDKHTGFIYSPTNWTQYWNTSGNITEGKDVAWGVSDYRLIKVYVLVGVVIVVVISTCRILFKSNSNLPNFRKHGNMDI